MIYVKNLNYFITYTLTKFITILIMRGYQDENDSYQ